MAENNSKMFLAITIPALICLLTLGGCRNVSQESTPVQDKVVSMEETAKTAYARFLSGDRTLLDDAQADMWWIPDFQDESMRYEYTYLDLDDDGISELIVQMEDNPSGYNGVFHFGDSRLLCWNSDTVEMTSRDYPLDNGNMVSEYDFNGTRSYTIFRYQVNGETENITNLFVREELIPEDSMEPCPYYEIDGEEVDKDEFDAQIGALIVDRLLDRSAWTAIIRRD